MKNEFFFEILVTDEQVAYTHQMVRYSIEHHTVTDIFARDPDGQARQYEFRFTGSLGEVVFADTYRLPRPTRSFGASNGQDFGQDFILNVDGSALSFDVKSMSRRNNHFKDSYVLNLPKYQMDKNHKTDYYFCMNIHRNSNQYIASFVGMIKKRDVQHGLIGTLYKTGTRRIKDDGNFFVFQRDTYEVLFGDIQTPWIDDYIRNLHGYREKHLITTHQKLR